MSNEPAKTLSWLYATDFAPPDVVSPSVLIEFCDRCRWLHRAQWVSTELSLTFPPPAIKSITTMPLNSEETGGRFRVWLVQDGSWTCCWDRKTEGGFPELKQLKQRVRDCIAPGQNLGHSDKKPHVPMIMQEAVPAPEATVVSGSETPAACER